MGLLRHHSFYRNQTIKVATNHAKALLAAQTSFGGQINGLNDGEILLYRYKIESEEQGTVYTIVGVTHVAGDTKSYTIIGNTPWTEENLEDKLTALDGSAKIAETTTEGNIQLYATVEEVNGKIQSSTPTIELKKISTTGKAEDVSITDTSNVINADTVEGALTEIAKEIDGMDLEKTTILKLTEDTLTQQNISQTDGKVTLDTATNLLKFKTAPSDTNPVVTQKDISGIAGSMHYRGAISINSDGSITYPTGINDTNDLTKGDVFVVATGGEYKESGGTTWKVETGDMFVWNGTKFDIINGENQVENKNAVIVAGNANSATIATVDGTDITAGVSVTAGEATIATKTSNGIVTLKAGITQDGTSGSVKNKEGDGNADITLHKVATTGSASDVIVTNTDNQFGEDGTNVQGALEAINSKYSTLKNYSKISLGQTTSIEPVNASSELTLKGDTWINLSKGEHSELEIKHKTNSSDIVDATGSVKYFTVGNQSASDDVVQITVPALAVDNAGHLTKITNQYYKLKLPDSIASAIQTITGNTQTLDQRKNLNNLKFVNVKTNTEDTNVSLETSLKTLPLERATGIVAYGYRGVLNGDINLSEGDFNDEPVIIIRGSKNIYVNLTEGDRKALAELAVQIRDKKIRVVNENFDNSTDNNPTTVEKIEYCVIPNFDIFNNSKEKLRALLNPEELYVLAYHEKLNLNIDDGLATAINTKNYIDSHHPKVVAGTNTTVTTSTTNGVTTYTVNATQAPQETSSVVAGEGISVSSNTADNTTEYTVSLDTHTTTATTNGTDNYTDETNTHKRVTNIAVDDYGRVIAYEIQTVTEDFDCGTF